MGNKKDKKPMVNAPTADEDKKPQVNVIQTGDLQEKFNRVRPANGADLNHVIDALTGAKEMLHDNPHAAEDYGMPENAVKQMNKIVAIGFCTAIAVEMQYGTGEWAKRMNKTQLEAMKEVAPMIGIEFDTKALPAPDADGTVVVTEKAVKVSKETKAALAAEAKKKIPTNPTEVENEEQLADALTAFLSDAKITRPFDRFMRAINFYRSYLTIQANKSDKKDDELAKIKSTTDAELLQDISTMATCPIIVQGYGNFLRGTVEDTKNIVHAFVSFRDASKNRATGKPGAEDADVASIVRVIIVWSCNEKIKEEQTTIEKIEGGIKVLKKDEKANAKAIESETKKIDGHKARIAHYRSVIDTAMNPSFDLADNFINNYNATGTDDMVSARKHFGIIMNSYYPGAIVDANTLTTALNNVQQRIGIIINMFTDVNLRRAEYSEENLKESEAEPAEEPKKLTRPLLEFAMQLVA